MINIEEEQNRRTKCLLVGEPGNNLAELKGLADTLGMETVEKLTLTRLEVQPAYGMGKGKAQEIADLAREKEADCIIFDFDLAPSKQRNWEKLAKIPCLDRQEVIIRIFAQRAQTKEAVLQVELARLTYSLPRLAHSYGDMARQRGGSYGSKGAGETQLELDQRNIREIIFRTKKELEKVVRTRETQRKKRGSIPVPECALIGYTNAGKSTLMNALTQAGVLAEDKLFATLDPTSRALTLPDGRRVMLIDTVGFIRRLPHGLVEAFKSTLEEAASATLILNVCDASSPDCAEHLEVTNRLLEELGCKGKPIIAVFNKCDAAPDLSWLSAGLHSVKISALTGEGLDRLLNEMVRALPPTRKKVTLLLPYSMGSDAALLREKGALDREEYRPDGLLMTVTADAKLLERYKDYIV